MAQSIPDRSMVTEVSQGFLDCLYSTEMPKIQNKHHKNHKNHMNGNSKVHWDWLPGSPPLAGWRDAHRNHLIIHLLHSVIYLQLTILCISHSHLIFWDLWLRSNSVLSVRLWRQLHKFLCESVKGLGHLSLILVSSECSFTCFISSVSYFYDLCAPYVFDHTPTVIFGSVFWHLNLRIPGNNIVNNDLTSGGYWQTV